MTIADQGRDAWASSPDEQLELYRQMQLIRIFDETVLELRAGGDIEGVVHPYIGEEAVAVGACARLRADDGLTSTHRGHGHCIAKGADPKRMMAELFGRRDGYCGGKGGSMHIADFGIGMLGANGIVAAGLPIACGAALAQRLTGSDRVAVCMFGEGAVGAGPFHESMNIAQLWALPVVFVCENNGWAVGSPPEQILASSSVAALAAGYGMASERVDGNDVLEVGRTMDAAVARARAGAGPTLVEAATFRMVGHAYRGADVPEQRDVEVLDSWRRRDPLLLLAAHLARSGVDDATLDRVADAARYEVQQAVEYARSSPLPEPSDALKDVFAA